MIRGPVKNHLSLNTEIMFFTLCFGKDTYFHSIYLWKHIIEATFLVNYTSSTFEGSGFWNFEIKLLKFENFLGAQKWVGAQMSWGPNVLGPKWVGAQMSRGPNESGPKWVGAQMSRGPNVPGPKWVGAQMSQGPKWGLGPNVSQPMGDASPWHSFPL